MKLRDIPKVVLADSLIPLTAREIWTEAVKRGLDKAVGSKGKTPDATIAAFLYTEAKRPKAEIVAEGSKPARFRLRATAVNNHSSSAEASKPSTSPQPIANSVAQHGPDSYSFLECAEKVLHEFGEREPMHYRDITKKSLELGWLVSDGATPDATMSAQLATDIKKRSAQGKKPRFVRHGKGYFGLAEWIDPIQNEIDKHNAQIRRQLLGKLREMSPLGFENLLRRLLDEMDFLDTEVTKASGDGGIDVRGTWKIADGILIKMAIQAKRWKANIQAPVVQAVRGALKGSERGMIITTSDFSKGAREEAEDPSKASTISLVNGEQLVKLLVQYGIGAKRKNVEILEIDKDFGHFSPYDE